MPGESKSQHHPYGRLNCPGRLQGCDAVANLLPDSIGQESDPDTRRQAASDSNMSSPQHTSSPMRSEEKPPVTVLIADDHPLVREGLAAVINRQPDMKVIAEASNGREALELFFSRRPDIALLDLRMPLMDGIEATTAICRRQPNAKVVIVSSYQSEEEVYRAMRAGVQGYLLKDAAAEDLIHCLHSLAEGKTWIPPMVGAKLVKRLTGQELTAREMEVLQAMAVGMSNKEIGALLNITESTVKVHVSHLLEKLNAGGRAEAISLALKRGLVNLESPRS